MEIVVRLDNIAGVERMLDDAAGLLRGERNRLAPAWKAIGSEILAMAQQNIMSRGAKVGGWKPLKPVTVLLRRHGRGAKITNQADLIAKGRTVKPLLDTSLMINSLYRGHAGNIFELKPMAVTVGTRDRKAVAHQYGGTSQFNFAEGSENRRRFERNVKKVLSGRRARRTASGRRSRAARNWNPFYFQQEAILKKMHGRAYRIPKRRIFWPLRESEKAVFVRMLRQHVQRELAQNQGRSA